MWKLGDLAEAKFGKYPHWPCLIVKDTELKKHYKYQETSQGKVCFYHVVFFADNSRRSWLPEEAIRPLNNILPKEAMTRAKLRCAYHEAKLASMMMKCFRKDFFKLDHSLLKGR